MSEFDVGTVVQLKSGGPKMTCKSKPSTDGEVMCQWFAGAKMEKGFFPTRSLIIVEGEDIKKAKR